MFQWISHRQQQLWYLVGLLALTTIMWFISGWIYWGEPAAPLGIAARLNIILIVLVVFSAIFLLRFYLQKQGAQKIIDPVQEKPSEEKSELRAKFADAIDVLKHAKFDSVKGAKNLYELPWYLMIGNPGSGKTSVILNSGLNFPLADRFGRNSLSGLGGTRQCDWWFTNEAVFIDTAGRYTSQDSNNEQDRSAWLTFLSLLTRYRKRRPINGVIVTISMQELLTATPDQRAQQARIIRARLDELTEQFNLPFPVYLMLTKLDLLAGFNEYFSDLAGDDSEQVWGFTLTRNAENAETAAPVPLDSLNKEMNCLLTRLNEKLLTRLQHERNPTKRASIVGFPQQFEIMKPLLIDFLNLTFSASRYTRQPQLRGLYFCSAKQEGAPIDRLAAAVVPQFGMRSVTNKNYAGKSYFLRQFFQSVLIPESEVAGVNVKQEQKILWHRRGAYIGMGTVATLLVTFWAGAMIKHYRFVDKMQQSLTHIQQIEKGFNQSTPLAEVADAINELQQIIELSDKEKKSWINHLGMSDDGISEAANVAYQHQLQNLFFPLLANTLKDQFSRAPEDHLYEDFRTYLMLLNPAHRDEKSLNSWLNRYYAKDEPHQKLTQQLMHTVFQQNHDAVIQHPDEVAIKNARAILLALPLPQRIYQQIRSDYANDSVDIRTEANLDLSMAFKSTAHANPYLISKMFTKAGYQQINISDAIDRVKKDRWMWGDTPAFSDENLAKTEEQVKTLYLTDYAAHWRMLLESLELPHSANLSDMVAAMRKLTALDQSALVAILKVVSYNTTLTEQNKMLDAAIKQTGLIGENIKSALAEKPTIVDLSFKPLNAVSLDSAQRPAALGQLLQAIRDAQDFLGNIASSPDAGNAALNATRARMQGGQDPLQKLALLAKEQPQPVQRWLSGLVQTGNAQLVDTSGGHLNQLWRDQVVSIWEQKLAGRYPFVRSSNVEVSMRDFQEFFKVGGVLDKFVQEHLAGLVDPRRNFVSSNAKNSGLSNSAVEHLRQAYRIQAAFFAADPNNVKVEFRIKPQTLDDRLAQFALMLGDQRVEYSHGPKIAHDLVWPANNSESIRLVFEDLNQTHFNRTLEGEWVWLHLLDSATKSAPSTQTITVQFKEQSKVAEFELALKQSINAFDPLLLATFDCPRSL